MKKLVLLFALLPLLIAVVAFPFLPEIIPLHWNFQGKIDRWGNRSSLLISSGLLTGICLLITQISKRDPKRQNYAKFQKAYTIIQVCCSAFFSLISFLTVYTAFLPTFNFSRILFVASGLLFCIIGNFMPKFRHNCFCGIKTPWTLSNEQIWNKTHRFGGVLWFWGGIAIVIFSLIFPINLFVWLDIVVFLFLILIPIVYSWQLAKNTNS